ncbi:hypothetical protein DC20_07525 [Rufibacter tibetensis]|uniref:TonB-dependent receptor plug domain-containing protein n=2 Tax=Rufibacter tibetensis TaxID=512763 RepID=A0A0P0CQZ4_9BACT|nr:hypothetical protein DC20_07525 [Rufibacter tibetensis]
MTPQHQGRFCQNCSKTVVDFTRMSGAEVVDWLTKQKAGTCGRFSQKQLGREFVSVSASKSRWTWKAAIFGLAVLLSPKNADGRYKVDSLVEQQVKPWGEELSIYGFDLTSLKDSTLTITGKVLDGNTKAPVSGAAVVLKGTTLGAPVDAKGTFSLQIPSSISLERATVVFSYIGYVAQEIQLNHFLNSPNATVLLPIDNTPLMGEVHIIKSKWYSPRSFYYKARNLFR